MPEFSKNCDVYQGYNFKKDKQSIVGFIKSLTVGGQALKADQTCNDPTDAQAKKTIPAVAVLSGFSWSTGLTDALYLSGQLTVENRQTLATLLYGTLTQMEVDVQFDLYEYDPVAKVYYACFGSDAALKGLLEKNGSELNLSVSEDPSTEVQSPLNYAFNVGIKPQPTSQNVTISTSSKNHVVKAWGLTSTG